MAQSPCKIDISLQMARLNGKFSFGYKCFITFQHRNTYAQTLVIFKIHLSLHLNGHKRAFFIIKVNISKHFRFDGFPFAPPFLQGACKVCHHMSYSLTHVFSYSA